MLPEQQFLTRNKMVCNNVFPFLGVLEISIARMEMIRFEGISSEKLKCLHDIHEYLRIKVIKTIRFYETSSKRMV